MRLFSFKKNKLNMLSDLELLDHYRNTGDNSCIDELFNRHANSMYYICNWYLNNKEDSRDVVMEIFKTLIEKLRYMEISNFKNWLSRVTKNKCLEELRKRKKEREHLEVDTEKIGNIYNFGEENPDYDHHKSAEKKENLIRDAIDKLKNDSQKTCLRLYLEGKKYKEIATKTGFTEKQVKNYIWNGKRNLKKILGDKLED